MLHEHHIIPKYAGGTDSPDNLIKLTVEEHAEAHRKLYEQYGRWQDRVARIGGKIQGVRAAESGQLALAGTKRWGYEKEPGLWISKKTGLVLLDIRNKQ